MKRIIADGYTFRHFYSPAVPLGRQEIKAEDCTTNWNGTDYAHPCKCGDYLIRWESALRRRATEVTE